MSITKLDPEHPLSKAGLKHLRVVKQLEVGLKPGDVVFVSTLLSQLFRPEQPWADAFAPNSLERSRSATSARTMSTRLEPSSKRVRASPGVDASSTR